MSSIDRQAAVPGRRAIAIGGVLVAGSLALTGCGGPEFAEGDCVHVYQQFTDHKLSGTDCVSTGFTLEMSDAVFEITSIIEGANGDCPRSDITFSDEPDDVTYCLDFY